jgi:putative intracellular protease/amidase
MKHILFIVTSSDKIGTENVNCGYEFSEVADPYIELTKAGYTVDFASIEGGNPPEHGYVDIFSNNKSFRQSAGFKRLNFSHKLSDINTDAYDAIFFPGGLGPMIDMVDNTLVKKTIAEVYESGRIVSAVCHGPVALLNVQLSNGKYLLEGKNVTSFTEQEEQAEKHLLHNVIPFLLDEALAKQGANFSKAKPFEEKVVVDGNLITGQNPASASGVAKAIILKLSA